MPDFQYTPTVRATTPGSRVRFETDTTSMVPASVFFGSGIGGAASQSVPGGVLRSGGSDGTIATVYGNAASVVTRMYTNGVPGAVLETITGVDLLPENPSPPLTLGGGSVDLSAYKTAAQSDAQYAGTPAWAANWFAALGNRALAPAVVSVTGSSTVQGYVATQTPRRGVSRMAAQMQARYTPSQVGFHARALDTGWSVAGGPSMTLLPGAVGRQAYTLPSGATVGRTDTCTGFRVFYGQGPGAAPFTISVDGGSAVTITPDTTGNARADGVWTSSTLTRASHSLLITATAAGALIEGAYVFDGDNTNGLQVFVDGHAGASVADFTSSGPARLIQQGVGLYVLMMLAGPSTAGSAGVDTTAPTVTSFTATPGNGQNTLAWSGTDNVAITRWLLKTGSTTLYDGTATSFTHTGLTNGTAVSYTVVAYDAAGNVSTTASASATPVSGAYDPTQISGLSYWFDPTAIGAAGGSDGSAVASWPDKSSNAATATQSTSAARPTYRTAGINSLPAVQFATAQQLISAVTATDAAFTLIATIAPTSTGNRSIIGATASGGHQVRVGGGTAGSFIVLLVNQGIGVRAQQTTATTATSAVMTVTFDGTNTVVRINGTPVATSATAQAAPSGGGTTTIGAKDTATGDAYTGYLGDIVKAGRVLTNTELLTEERRQGAKYGITVA